MFTGIVEEVGRVISFERRAAAWRLVIEAAVVVAGTNVGDSIAVNGCCLTVVACETHRLSFDLLEETVRLTNIAQVGPGGVVNLERSLRPDGKMGGHFVTGHIDCPGEIETLEPRGADRYLRVRYPAQHRGLLVPKGSIAVDGVSLTVVEVTDDWFSIWLIPHTMEATNLGQRRAGTRVNLEFDMLAKYVDRLLTLRGEAPSAGQPAGVPVKPIWQS
ncbi:MAG: riboflavin synthase [Opitutaceae bacterium]